MRRSILLLAAVLAALLCMAVVQSHGPNPGVFHWYQNDASSYNTNNDNLDCRLVPQDFRVQATTAYTGSGTVSVQIMQKSDPSQAGDSIFFLDTAITASTTGATPGSGYDPSGGTTFDLSAGDWICLQIDGSPSAVEVGVSLSGKYLP